MNDDVAILIVTYNSANQIKECLDSVIAQARAVRQKIIVLDNNSLDDTVSLIEQTYPQVLLLRPGTNLGFAKGVNEAARHANADYVLLLNPDTVILNHAVDVIVEFARTHPGHGLYGGRTLKPDGSLEPSSCWGRPSLWSMAMFALGFSTLFRRNPFFDPESLGSWPRDTVKEVGVVTGCFLLADLHTWNRLKGFDERFFMYGEDVDLAMRSHALGCHPVICPHATLVHEVGQSSKKPTDKMMLLYKGKACLVRTHWRGLSQKIGLFFLLLGVGLRALAPWLRSLVGGPSIPERWWALWLARREWLLGYPKQGNQKACTPPSLTSS